MPCLFKLFHAFWSFPGHNWHCANGCDQIYISNFSRKRASICASILKHSAYDHLSARGLGYRPRRTMAQNLSREHSSRFFAPVQIVFQLICLGIICFLAGLLLYSRLHSNLLPLFWALNAHHLYPDLPSLGQHFLSTSSTRSWGNLPNR